MVHAYGPHISHNRNGRQRFRTGLSQVPRLGPQPRPYTSETLLMRTLANPEDQVVVGVTSPLSFTNNPWARSAPANNL